MGILILVIPCCYDSKAFGSSSSFSEFPLWQRGIEGDFQQIYFFGGKLRTASQGEFVLSRVIAFVAYVILGSFSIDTDRRSWKTLHE